MKLLTKKFATVVGFDLTKIALDMEISNDSEAVEYCLENRGFYFQTYEVPAEEVEDEEFCIDPSNCSERNYVGAPAIHNAASVLKKLERKFAAALRLSDELDEMVISDLRVNLANAKENGAEAVYINEPGSRDGYIRLNPGDKVYDMNGCQTWPKPQQ